MDKLLESVKVGRMLKEDASGKFNGVEFEKLLPDNMEFKSADIKSDGSLYYVTQDEFYIDDLKNYFIPAMKKFNISRAYVIDRDRSNEGYSIDLGETPNIREGQVLSNSSNTNAPSGSDTYIYEGGTVPVDLRNKIKDLKIKDGVKSIEDEAFYSCRKITRIDLPDSVTYIGNRAFELCSGLKSITIPDSVTKIGDRAFLFCSSLTSISFDGIKKQWNDVSKGRGWDFYVKDYTIHCTDGDLKKGEE